jgi:fluoride exporter
MVLVGGGVGAVARYALGTAISTRFGGRFPMGTMVINVTGSFLIGLLMVLITERLQPHPNWRLLLVVGFLGGYTTFSSFEFETYQAIRDGGHWIAAAYVMGSVLLGYVGVWIGAAIARW